MKTDHLIQEDILEALRWEPFLNETEIGVAVKDGLVTLSGMVDTYAKKLSVEKVVKKVSGVKAIAEDIQVGISPNYARSDTEIADAILTALNWHVGLQEDRIKIKVENGIVKLEGQVDWLYQRNNAKSAIENLVGVKAVINLITIAPKLMPVDINHKITAALKRSAALDAEKIRVDIEGSKVILTGKVRSLAEKEEAEHAASVAHGITSVENNLEIVIPSYAFTEA